MLSTASGSISPLVAGIVLESVYLLSAFRRKVAVQSHNKLLSSKYLLRFLDYHVMMLGKQCFWSESQL